MTMGKYETGLMVAHEERMRRFSNIQTPMGKDAEDLQRLIAAQAIKITDLENDFITLFAQVQKMDLIVEQIKAYWIAETIDKPTERGRSGKQVATEVAKAHGLTFHELVSERRHKKYIKARHEAMHMMYDETSLSMVQIGKILNRDHTSVLHGIKAYKNKTELDTNLRIAKPWGLS